MSTHTDLTYSATDLLADPNPQSTTLADGYFTEQFQVHPQSVFFQFGTAEILDIGVYGPYRIIGSINRVAGGVSVPVSRRVACINQETLRRDGEVWSNATTGAYEVTRLNAGKYTIISTDHTGVDQVVVADNVEAVL
jgi:hypothetical protein